MEPDQGDRYELAGVVAELAMLAPFAAAQPKAQLVPLDVPGLGLVPVTGVLAAITTPAMIGAVPATGVGEGLFVGPESGFAHLTTGLLDLLEVMSAAGPVAYLEADYRGRDGRQTAAVWRGGTPMLGPLLLGRNEAFVPGAAPISRALRLVGVSARGRHDEFVVAGLGRCRRTEDWTR